MNDQQKQLDAAVAAGCPGVPNISNAGPLIHGKGFIDAAIASVDAALASVPTEKPAPMTWEQFVTMAVGDGWIHDLEFPSWIEREGVDCDVQIYRDGTFEITRGENTVLFNYTSLELAYAAANALAEATGGWA